MDLNAYFYPHPILKVINYQKFIHEKQAKEKNDLLTICLNYFQKYATKNHNVIDLLLIINLNKKRPP